VVSSKQVIVVWPLVSNFSATWREQVTFQLVDVRFVLYQQD
jgi:hypothetical protein